MHGTVISPGTLTILLFISIFGASYLSTNTGTASVFGTEVGGILWDNTTWTAANSPYISARASLTVLEDNAPPITTDSYDGEWHNADFTITLTATDNESGVAVTYYSINNAPVEIVSVYGQPEITLEGAYNTLEYWSTDNSDNEEDHHFLVNIGLDKTPPTIFTTMRNPSGDVQPNQQVRISVNVSDSLSGIDSVKLAYFTNRSEYGLEFPMMLNQTSGLYERTILVPEADTLVKYHITAYDKARNNITDDNAGKYYVYTVIPESPSLLILTLFMTTTLAVAASRKKLQVQTRQ